MYAVADTNRLVADGVITPDQAKEIEHRAREGMVAMAINSVLCLGILAATGGLIFVLGNAVAVALFGALAGGLGMWILARGTGEYAMFGNAATLIGAGMLIGGGTLEMLNRAEQIAGWVLGGTGAAILGLVGVAMVRGIFPARFALGAIGLMGLVLHLGGMWLVLEQNGAAGMIKSLFFLYSAVAIAVSGWFLDVRLVTALAIMPFAQVLDTGTEYYHAVYAFYSPEPTLSILQMAVLIGVCFWVAGRSGARIANHAGILAVLGFIIANMCALVGSLWGDVVGQTIWGPGHYVYSGARSYEDYLAARDAFTEQNLKISPDVYSILWAIVLVAVIAWAAQTARRGLLNAGLTFGAIHAYTQFFESFADEPMAYAIGGLTAIPLAWGLWRVNRWMTARRAD